MLVTYTTNDSLIFFWRGFWGSKSGFWQSKHFGLTNGIQGARERPRLNCMRCFDVSGDGASYFLAGSKSAAEMMRIWREETDGEEELVTRSGESLTKHKEMILYVLYLMIV